MGVIYYNLNSKCLVRLMTSIFALRKVYDGPCTVIHEGEPREQLEEFCAHHDVDVLTVPKQGENALVRKSQLWRVTPYQYSVFLDADTIPLASPAPLLELAKAHGFVVHHFSDWKTTGGMVSRRIRNWKPVIGADGVKGALAYGKAINTGIFAFDKDSSFMPEWERITREGWAKNCTRRLVDEVAAQVMLHDHDHAIVGPEWGCSGRYGGHIGVPKIMHYHGQKHVMDDLGCVHWKRNYNEMHDKYAEWWPLIKQANGDKRFGRWYATRNQREDVTMVTAVNPKYLGKLQDNWREWMKDDSLSGQQWVIFVNRMRLRDKRLAFLRKHDNVRLVKWRFMPAGDNIRERMLSAFVFGVSEHVKTPYWMKLDCDATPKKAWEWPAYQSRVITGHRCGYTVSKAANSPAHFLNALDDHKGGEPAFPADITVKRYRHKRLASYCWIERTDFTRELAEWCGDRLPVPSHDTTACYFAQHVKGYRIGDQMLRMNMKEYFQP
jgi:hypothetical protein